MRMFLCGVDFFHIALRLLYDIGWRFFISNDTWGYGTNVWFRYSELEISKSQ